MSGILILDQGKAQIGTVGKAEGVEDILDDHLFHDRRR